MNCANCLHYRVCTDAMSRVISGCPFYSKVEIDDFVEYLKSTQVNKSDFYGKDFIDVEDIQLAAKEFKEGLK